MRITLNAIAIVLLVIFASPSWAKDEVPTFPYESPNSLLTLQNVFERLEKEHPLLKKSQANITLARGRVLKALGKFDPNLVNDWELERLVKNGSTKNVGFNDTFVELRHPWGIKGFAGFRAGIGDVEVADLGINTTNTPLLGIVFPLLRGFITNPASGELKKSSLAEEQANLEIQQTRQDLYLGAATQYWNWVAASKVSDVQKKSVSVAEGRLDLLTQQVKEGARPEFDVIDATREVQWRKDKLIKAKRKVDKEQYKLALFLWNGDELMVPEKRKVPAFPKVDSKRWLSGMEQVKREATEVRPEIQLVNLEAQFNNIDLDVAENNLLPDLSLEAQPTRKPGEFVLGLGYRFGVQLSIPLFQREAKGDIMRIKGKADQLKLLKDYRQKQIAMDIANARSALIRAEERVHILKEGLTLAKKLEEGERTRFQLGATTLLVVNLRERSVLEANESWIWGMADYQKAVALYQWAIGNWVDGLPPENSPKNTAMAN
ncbi:MAG: TolC family protein [Candidatus Nitronauta litoralis]|uniref:TolC family protein n=1 Tax=Candidatus Nitronauta litoralis TaxID=2705533 RepID=A0A7T0BYG3_9BACT|nr:MAG: TolC family protein [Candidatus Nitronauta litoralis]